VSVSDRLLQVGIISDTHGLLRPEALGELAGMDHILHAGDVGDADILQTLRKIAPVTAIRGNVDISGECSELPSIEVVELAGSLFYLVHAINDLDIAPAAAGIRVLVYGHSHRPEVKEHDGVIYVNPGSAGPRRFNLPVTLAKAVVEYERIRIQIVPLV
jgi:uncharacterized protein